MVSVADFQFRLESYCPPAHTPSVYMIELMQMDAREQLDCALAVQPITGLGLDIQEMFQRCIAEQVEQCIFGSLFSPI